MKHIKNIIFDFDGVILESNQIKIEGFYQLFKHYGNDKARRISKYFEENAGLSRYDIFNYFYKNIIEENLDEKKIRQLSVKYSSLVKDEVIKAEFVDGCKAFLNNNEVFNLFLVSSTDEQDLKYFCRKISIERNFVEILGSPVKKSENLKNLKLKYNFTTKDTVYVGDSLNDYHATIKNNLIFIGRNSGLYDFNALDGIIVIDNLSNLENVLLEI